MASIEKRGDKFRIRIRPEGLPLLSMTFPTYEEAEEWVEEHEQAYIDDHIKYKKWLWYNRASMKFYGIYHVYRPLEDF